MSGSEEEEENYCFFGKPLEPYDEDAFPKKKPISVEEQIATDAQGRRRFHGAFTGGFSAGFFNTVGSLEGWTPSEFKSTRQEKAKGIVQKPQDFMDDEDMSEYGIAPQVVRATSDYSTSKKRKKQVFSDGPIPGIPVLHSLLTSGNETVGYLLLKNIGIQDKINKQQDESDVSQQKVYGCHMPKSFEISSSITDKQYFIPSIYKAFLDEPKYNTFGLGYKGLDKSHINLFQSSNLVVSDKNNKKLSIAGQAFGVGAFEEDDDDIYMKEDITKYDFELTSEKQAKKTQSNTQNLIFEAFVPSKTPLLPKKMYQPPTIPHSFTGQHKVRKSRFDPVPEEAEAIDQKDINPAIRAKYLGEEADKTYTASKPIIEKKQNDSNKQKKTIKKVFDLASALVLDRFVSASQKEDISNILEPVTKSETTHGTEQMRDAARMKMFGRLTRITIDWQPCSLLCKRFNVPEPHSDQPDRNRKRTKNLIFEYQKHQEADINLKPGLSLQRNPEENDTVDSSPPVSIKEEANESQEITSQVPETEEHENHPTEVIEDLPKDITERVEVEKKVDLFKAVFLSSSESEDEVEKEEEKQDRAEELKSNVFSEQLIPKIKPIKEGILSNVNFHAFSKPTKPSKDEENLEKNEDKIVDRKEDDQSLLYGPKKPEKSKEINLPKVLLLSTDSEDEWVEKDSKEKKKKHKKDKKSKHHKSKKHKHDKKKKHKD